MTPSPPAAATMVGGHAEDDQRQDDGQHSPARPRPDPHLRDNQREEERDDRHAETSVERARSVKGNSSGARS